MTLGIIIVAPILFIWGGFLLLTSSGAEARVSQARSVLWGTVVGILITLGAFLIVNTFLWLVQATTESEAGIRASWSNIQCSVK